MGMLLPTGPSLWLPLVMVIASLSIAPTDAVLRGLESVDTCDPDVSPNCRYVCVFEEQAADCRYRLHDSDVDGMCGGDDEVCCPHSTCSKPSLSCHTGICRSCGSEGEAVCTDPSVSKCGDGLVAAGNKCAVTPAWMTSDEVPCGVWLQQAALLGPSFPQWVNTMEIERCLVICMDTEGCNGITLDIESERCYLKPLSEVADYQLQLKEHHTSYILCEECGQRDQRCCGSGQCHLATLECVDSSCVPCGGLSEPACTASEAAACEDTLIKLRGMCQLNPAHSWQDGNEVRCGVWLHDAAYPSAHHPSASSPQSVSDYAAYPSAHYPSARSPQSDSDYAAYPSAHYPSAGSPQSYYDDAAYSSDSSPQQSDSNDDDAQNDDSANGRTIVRTRGEVRGLLAASSNILRKLNPTSKVFKHLGPRQGSVEVQHLEGIQASGRNKNGQAAIAHEYTATSTIKRTLAQDDTGSPEPTTLTRTRTGAECGTWQVNSVYEGHGISASSKAASGRDGCEKQCSMEPGCNAVSYGASEDFCWLHKIPEGAEVARKRGIDAMFICEPAAVPAAAPETVPAAAPETVPAAAPDTVAAAAPETVPAAVPAAAPAYPEGCGEWLEGKDYMHNDIPGASQEVPDREACLELCEATANCNGVTFRDTNERGWKTMCWVKNLPEGAEIRDISTMSTMRICVSGPVEAPGAGFPVVTPVGEPAGAPVQAPLGQPVQAPVVEQPVPAPVGEPSEAPVEQPAQAPVEQPVQAPEGQPVQSTAPGPSQGGSEAEDCVASSSGSSSQMSTGAEAPAPYGDTLRLCEAGEKQFPGWIRTDDKELCLEACKAVEGCGSVTMDSAAGRCQLSYAPADEKPMHVPGSLAFLLCGECGYEGTCCCDGGTCKAPGLTCYSGECTVCGGDSEAVCVGAPCSALLLHVHA